MNQNFTIIDGILEKYHGQEETVIIPDGVTAIRYQAFHVLLGNEFLKSVILPEGVTRIGKEAFFWCKALKHVQFPDSLTEIGDSAFYSCEKLTDLSLPPHLDTISEHAFSCCKSLTEIALPDKIRKIGLGAFNHCDAVKTLTFCQVVCELHPERGFGWEEAFKMADYIRHFIQNPRYVGAVTHMTKHIQHLLFIDEEHFRKVLESGRIFTSENISQAIQLANQLGCYEKQILLTEYKARTIGFQEIANQLYLS